MTCTPNPCGDFSQCRILNNAISCKCLQDYIGRPPYCRPECIDNSDCPNNRACINNKCVDPCKNGLPCGRAALCEVRHHKVFCSCQEGLIGDPYSMCVPVISSPGNNKLTVLTYDGNLKYRIPHLKLAFRLFLTESIITYLIYI